MENTEKSDIGKMGPKGKDFFKNRKERKLKHCFSKLFWENENSVGAQAITEHCIPSPYIAPKWG